jgi:hypothetical protein
LRGAQLGAELSGAGRTCHDDDGKRDDKWKTAHGVRF